jgi:hypothetical protein
VLWHVVTKVQGPGGGALQLLVKLPFCSCKGPVASTFVHHVRDAVAKTISKMSEEKAQNKASGWSE